MEDLDGTYYLRSKRRKIDDGEEPTCSYFNPNQFKRKNAIMTMPLEILQNVFKFITFHELSERVRRVNRKFKLAAEDLLNKSFRNVAKKLKDLTSQIFMAIDYSHDDMEIKCFCRMLNILDVLNFQQTVIMATIWRYVYNEFYRTEKACMYGGLILDLYDVVLYQFTTKPYRIYGPAVVRDYALPEEVKNIIYLTKTFCIHFDKITEEPTRRCLSSSGCKIVDLLDCANFAIKTVVSQRVIHNTFSAKYSYYFKNAWFVAFGVPPDKEMPLSQKQRMMHMRVRRIVLAHTEMFMQQQHYEREVLVRPNPILKKPSVIVYTGYGDVHDTFFCYGAMNDAGYMQKFDVEEQNDEDVEDEVNHEVVLNVEQLDEQEETVPHLGLEVVVDIDCPVAYAPYTFVKENEESVRNEERSSSGMFNLSVEFNFPGAHYPRLPSAFSYCKKISTRAWSFSF